MAVSIREVALYVGVSTATVSRVLNDLRDVSVTAKTRERVLKAANELGYHPSAVARSLRNRRTNVLGVILPPSAPNDSPLRDPFFSALLESALQAATAHHMDTMVYTGYLGQEQEKNIARFRDGRCDGLLVFYQPLHSDLITNLLDNQIPTVLVDDQRDDPRLSCVDVDNTASAYQMTEYLIGLGHQRIAVLSSGGVESNFIALRAEGYRAALKKQDIPYRESLVHYDAFPWVPQNIMECVDRLMNLPARERPTAIFCFGDDVAALAIAALNWRNIRVPQDMSVAGFNDDGRAAQVHPPLTTLRQPFLQIGASAIDLLVDQIADISCRGRKITFPTELVVRDSTSIAPSD